MPRLTEADAAARSESGRSKDFLEVLARGFRVIDALNSGGEALSLSDVARLTSLPRPSVGRVLYTLCELGYAEQAGRTFRLTPKMVSLAAAYLNSSGRSRILQGACDELSTATGQSALAGVLDGDDVLVVAYSMPQELLATHRGVGYRMPAYCTSGGRVILSEMTDERLDEFLDRLEPEPQTASTITDKSVLRQNILAVRRDGISIANDEYILGWCSIAFPLRRYDGTLFGALSLNCRNTPGLTEAKLADMKAIAAAKVSEIEQMLV